MECDSVTFIIGGHCWQILKPTSSLLGLFLFALILDDKASSWCHMTSTWLRMLLRLEPSATVLLHLIRLTGKCA